MPGRRNTSLLGHRLPLAVACRVLYWVQPVRRVKGPFPWDRSDVLAQGEKNYLELL